MPRQVSLLVVSWCLARVATGFVLGPAGHRPHQRLAATATPRDEGGTPYDVRRVGAILAELAERTFTGRATTQKKKKPRRTDARQALLEAVATNGRPAPRDAATRKRVDDLCRALEATTTTTELDALAGDWRVVYSTAPPPSNGMLGPFVGRATQSIDLDSRTYANELQLFGATLRLDAAFDATDDSTLRVRFETLSLRGPGGLALASFRFPDGVERTWRLSYNDADLRVVRAAVDGGKRVFSQDTGDEALFVLVRDRDAKEAKRRLLGVVKAGDRRDVEAAIDALAATAPPTNAAFRRLLDAEYEVIWTTEAELNALTTRPACLGAFQTVEGPDLTNLVRFQDGSFLSVESSCEPTAPSRVFFEFQRCRARFFNLTVPLPPVGAGYFDVVYIDDDLRVSKDSRGDLQVAARRGTTGTKV